MIHVSDIIVGRDQYENWKVYFVINGREAVAEFGITDDAEQRADKFAASLK